MLRLYTFIYERILFPNFIAKHSAQETHEWVMQWLRRTDQNSIALKGFKLLHRLAFQKRAIAIGSIMLDYPLILAAGFVKGQGFQNEAQAHEAVQKGENIIPGWRSMPNLVGIVEFGSFTRWPRRGNSGTVLWREESTRSTQNRVGLKNPGALAAAEFLCLHRDQLPTQFGINIAVSPNVENPNLETREVLEALEAFLSRSIYPTWFTLNLSCPNTEDDPTGKQTEDKAEQLCGRVVDQLKAFQIPLWVKIGPNLSQNQYQCLLAAFERVGVQAVVATNTMPAPAPSDANLIAGVGGGCLYNTASEVVSLLIREKHKHGYRIEVIACGGVLDGQSYQAYRKAGVKTVQYWSALVYRGPLAAAQILKEAGE